MVPVRSPRRRPRVSPQPDGLSPVAGEDPVVLILGSFPGRLSLASREYYGNAQNHFWMIMEELFSLDRSLPYPERCARLAGRGIALWDVVSVCSRGGSADSTIRNPRFNNLEGFLLLHPTVRLIALNGTTAGRYYAESRARTAAVPSVILPSTSPANARLSLPEKMRIWDIVRITCEKNAATRE